MHGCCRHYAPFGDIGLGSSYHRQPIVACPEPCAPVETCCRQQPLAVALVSGQIWQTCGFPEALQSSLNDYYLLCQIEASNGPN
mmetsp:Transcript_49172/g.115004  ORF Transcript_49172/g.115004 Transcript_49172/m.115004 type:complete len:84 (-) Transcript_49172:1757-2008(-)